MKDTAGQNQPRTSGGRSRQNSENEAERPSDRVPEQGRESTRMAPTADARWAWLVLAVAVFSRLVYLFSYLKSPLLGNFHADFAYYLNWAREIASGDWVRGEVFEQGPLYPYLLGLFLSLIGEELVFVLLLQCLLGAFGCVLVYRCGLILFDRPTAVIAGFLAALYGPLIFYDCMIMKSFLSPLLTVGALYCGLRFSEEGRAKAGWAAGAGICVGLACLIRENHVLLLIPLASWIWLRATDGSTPRRWQIRLRQLCALGSAFVLCLIPSSVHNWVAGGEFVPVTAGGGEVFYIAHGPFATGYYNPPPFVTPEPTMAHQDFRIEAEKHLGHSLSRKESSDYWYGQSWKCIIQSPLRAIRLTLWKALVMVNDYEVADTEDFGVARRFIPLLPYLPKFGWIFGFSCVDVLICLKDPRRYVLLLGFVAAHGLTIILLYNYGRFRIGFAPLLTLLAAHGLICTLGALRVPGTSRRTSYMFLAIAGTFTVVSYLPITPIGYRIGEQLTIAQLALDSGQDDLTVKEAELTLSVLRTEIPRQAWDASLEVLGWRASSQSLLAQAKLGQDRYVESLDHFAASRHVARQTNLREGLLIRNLTALEDAVQKCEQPQTTAKLRRELEATAEELVSTAPQNPAYLAILILYSTDAEQKRRGVEALETLQQKGLLGNERLRAWYLMGRAFSGERTPDGVAAAADFARQALSLWPDHVYRHELEDLLALDRQRH